jgi:hypothetical protein
MGVVNDEPTVSVPMTSVPEMMITTFAPLHWYFEPGYTSPVTVAEAQESVPSLGGRAGWRGRRDGCQ